ncbi:unnamed protein product [Lactuca saligna]|uniref:PGG domain-containing protein n=1 Tax=Lactuca saligna TaxID=75948 RepID=A0AA35VPR3_LACSI|nr:unnamed protein product [Lactuca saligna]
MKEQKAAKEVLKLVCDEIEKSKLNDAHYHTRPVLEAACHGIYEVVDEILMRSPEAIQHKDESVYDDIQKWRSSCSHVFAATITVVPGGSNQEIGIPVFTKEIAFTIFAITDAISLFASSIALLMFLSILT